jgi:hypothetical protein
MRGLWKRGAVALGVVVLTGSVGFAQPAGLKKDLAETPPFWSTWFGESEKPMKLVGEVPKGEKDKGAVAPEPPPPTVADKNEQYQRLSNAFARRQAVIDKLREIAMETNDAALGDEALRLEEMAQRVFKRETGRLSGIATAVPQPDALDRGNGGQAIRGAAPAGQPSRNRGMTPESLERSAKMRGGDQ